MLDTAVEVLREKGAAGVTIDEVLARSGAPRGSVYHHFPDGRSQLLTEALLYAGDAITAVIDDAAAQGTSRWCDSSSRSGSARSPSDFAAGCPVVAAAIGSAGDDPALTAIAGDIFDRWRVALTRAFVADGFDEADAGSLAMTCIAALEGAVVLCRATRTIEPLREVALQIEFLIKSREFVHRFGLPSAGR